MTSTSESSAITLKGSSEIVTEFFGYAINSIIYQRGLCPPEWFKRANKYGITLFVPSDRKLVEYVQNVMMQVHKWLLNNDVQKLVLVVTGKETKENLERWVFCVETTDSENRNPEDARAKVNEKQISKDIAGIIRQITSSVSWMPLIEEECVYDILVYTRDDAEVPLEWEESDAKCISNCEEVKLRSFSTKVHSVHTMVAYRDRDDE